MSNQHRIEGWDEWRDGITDRSNNNYRRLAANVIAQAVHDLRDRERVHRESAWEFFFSDSPNHRALRNFYFIGAGLTPPQDSAALMRMIQLHQRKPYGHTRPPVDESVMEDS